MLQVLLIVLLVVGFHRGWNVFGQAATAVLLSLVAGIRIAHTVQDPIWGIGMGVAVFVGWLIAWCIARAMRKSPTSRAVDMSIHPHVPPVNRNRNQDVPNGPSSRRDVYRRGNKL